MNALSRASGSAAPAHDSRYPPPEQEVAIIKGTFSGDGQMGSNSGSNMSESDPNQDELSTDCRLVQLLECVSASQMSIGRAARASVRRESACSRALAHARSALPLNTRILRRKRIPRDIVRAAASAPEAARAARDVVADRVLVPIAEAIDADQPKLRASLINSQMVGLIMARYIVALEPLSSLPADKVVQAIAPNLQRYLTGSLGKNSK
jgi:Tetracyclin repressor-like, C-terminal domain